MLRNTNNHFWELTPPSSDVKKCQQTFLVPLPEMTLGVMILLVYKHGNMQANVLFVVSWLDKNMIVYVW